MNYEIIYSRQAQKDAKKLNKSNLKERAQSLLRLVKMDPYASPPQKELKELEPGEGEDE